MELLIGCGNKREKLISLKGKPEWDKLVTLDNDPNCGADIEHDLERMPLPFADETFDEIHAYHILEHTGRQGDFRFFFAQWEEFYRLLKPGGLVCGIVPSRSSPWAWADPGHTKIIERESFVFLDQTEYTKQVGTTALADYRRVYRADFAPLHWEVGVTGEQNFFVLQAVKPSRISV
jgi:SAM-dependent methyltransferase